MKPFEYAAPKKLEEALSLLSDRWGETEILAGGTDLVTGLKQKINTPKRLVSLKNLAQLKGIEQKNKKLVIGAATSLAEIAEHKTVKDSFPSMGTAIQGIGSTQMISQGTIGGDLCQRPRCWYYRNGFGLFGKQGDSSLIREGDNRYHAIFGNDGPALFVSPSSLGPALIALGASMQIAGKNGKTRTVSAKDFFKSPATENDRETALQPTEILTHIEIPMSGMRNATYEVRHRSGLDWPYVTASVALPSKTGSGSSKASVVLGHVAPVPWVVPDVEALLGTGTINESVAVRCAEAAAKGAKPLSGNGYKVQLVKVAVKRALLAASQQA